MTFVSTTKMSSSPLPTNNSTVAQTTLLSEPSSTSGIRTTNHNNNNSDDDDDDDNYTAAAAAVTKATTTATATTTTILVLYGSQTGNSQQAALDFCQSCTSQQLYDIYQRHHHHHHHHFPGSNSVNSNISQLQLPSAVPPPQQQQQKPPQQIQMIQTKCMSCDDFLEVYDCEWTEIVIVFVSSYGCGGPPLGCHSFRTVCDALLLRRKQQQVPVVQMLDGSMLQYAICGLGDSKFTTYMENPTRIQTLFQQVFHAREICPMGMADASYNNNTTNDQAQIIDEWMDQLWLPLSRVIYDTTIDNNDTTTTTTTTTTTDTNTKQQLQRLQQQTIEICQEVIPDFQWHSSKQVTTKQPSSSSLSLSSFVVITTILVLFVSIIVAMYIRQSQ